MLDLLPGVMLELSDEIRMLALLVILFKVGLGLDKNKILAQGSVAIRLGFLPDREYMVSVNRYPASSCFRDNI